jgi:nucleoside-diphosphate-sugar epimerase
MISALVTGGAGFFGDILKARLLDAGYNCVSIDLEADGRRHPNLTTVRGDIRDRQAMEALFARHRFDCIFHCAAILAHDAKDREFLWSSNVDGTRRVAELAAEHRVPKVVFTSSNCLWADPFNRPVTEDDVPHPREIYGQSKWEGEKILLSYAEKLEVAIIRTPTIIDEGRLGLLSILFEFIDEGRRVWVVGGGNNRYQFVYAPDLADACMRAAAPGRTGIFNVGSDHVQSLREVYQSVIDRARTGARIASLPRTPTLQLMRLAHVTGFSPLGPYQYRMIAESFEFDTRRARTELGWTPTLTNADMLSRAFQYYREHRREIEARTDVSAHKRPAKMGVIRLLKWMS